MAVFYLNKQPWDICVVKPYDPMLVDRTGRQTLATTDPQTRTVYLSEKLRGALLSKVLLHEIGHCVMVSFHLLDDIHRAVKQEYWIDAEEWLCNYIADYGFLILKTAYRLLGDKAWDILPLELEKLVA